MTDEIAMSQVKILVAGASGFIGTRLIEKLAGKSKFMITALVRDRVKAHQLRARGIHVFVADMSNRKDIGRAVQGHHTVINLAHDFKRSQSINLRNFSHLSEACIEHGVRHFVQVSSIVVYDDWPVGELSEESSFGQPGTEYKNTKVAIENALQSSSEKNLLHSTILQPTIVYGPYSWLWTDCVVEKLLSGTVVLPAKAEGICNAVYVDDVVDALILAAMRPSQSCEKFIISGPNPPTWQEFYESHNHFLGMDSIQYIDVATLMDKHTGVAGKMKSVLANPLQLTNWKPVRHLLNILEKLLGKKGIEDLKSLIKGPRKSRGSIIYFPGADELKLYRATGVCRFDKARKVLAYAPKIDFQAGFSKTAKYLDGGLGGNLAVKNQKKG